MIWYDTTRHDTTRDGMRWDEIRWQMVLHGICTYLQWCPYFEGQFRYLSSEARTTHKSSAGGSCVFSGKVGPHCQECAGQREAAHSGCYAQASAYEGVVSGSETDLEKACILEGLQSLILWTVHESNMFLTCPSSQVLRLYGGYMVWARCHVRISLQCHCDHLQMAWAPATAALPRWMPVLNQKESWTSPVCNSCFVSWSILIYSILACCFCLCFVSFWARNWNKPFDATCENWFLWHHPSHCMNFFQGRFQWRGWLTSCCNAKQTTRGTVLLLTFVLASLHALLCLKLLRDFQCWFASCSCLFKGRR